MEVYPPPLGYQLLMVALPELLLPTCKASPPAGTASASVSGTQNEAIVPLLCVELLVTGWPLRANDGLGWTLCDARANKIAAAPLITAIACCEPPVPTVQRTEPRPATNSTRPPPPAPSLAVGLL